MAGRLLILFAAVGLLLGGCAAKSPASVSRSELASIRKSYSSINVGDSKAKVLESFKAGNSVKLGSASIGGAAIEEWKVEAFHDEDKRKDMFVTFLYFCNDRFVESSDVRIDFRTNPSVVDRWKPAGSK